MMVANISKQYLRTPDCAEYCGLAVSTLEKLRLTGGGPVFIKRGRTVLYGRADLDTWLDGLRRRSTSDRGGVAA
jgi:predicted DNA-binding transcriptional regulator AlpA